MVDIHSKAKRSAIMSAVRSKNNKSTEIKMLSVLKKEKIKGWRRHINIVGHPDFAWRKEKIALFIDGCFWHGCNKCYKAPKSNVEFWLNKVAKNRARDSKNARLLKKQGWHVLRITECQLRTVRGVKWILKRIRLHLETREIKLK